MPAAPDLGYVGVGLEATKGTGVVPTMFLPVMQSRVGKDLLMPIDDMGMRGSAYSGPFDTVGGPIYSTFDIPDSPAFADSTLPWLILGLLGDVTVPAATRVVADGVTVNASPLITSATLAFTQNDIGRTLTTPNFPAGAFILSVQSATNATMNVPATAGGAAQSFTIGTASLFAHCGSILNSGTSQPKGLSLTDFYGFAGGTPARRYAGCQVAEATIKFNADGLLTVSAKLVGLPSLLVAKPAASWTTVTPHPGWECWAAVGGTLVTRVMSAELSFKRDTKPQHTADGTQAPYGIWQDGLTVDGKLALIAEDDSDFLNNLNNSKPAVSLSFRHGVGIAGAASTFVMSKCNYRGATPNHSGSWMAWDADISALPNATDAGASGGFSAVRAQFQNTLPSGTYQ